MHIKLNIFYSNFTALQLEAGHLLLTNSYKVYNYLNCLLQHQDVTRKIAWNLTCGSNSNLTSLLQILPSDIRKQISEYKIFVAKLLTQTNS